MSIGKRNAVRRAGCSNAHHQQRPAAGLAVADICANEDKPCCTCPATDGQKWRMTQMQPPQRNRLIIFTLSRTSRCKTANSCPWARWSSW
jgi:hypothetical protein